MEIEYDGGVNQNIITARRGHPDFKEKHVKYDDIRAGVYECPGCKGGNLRAYSTLVRCCIEDCQHGRLRQLEAEWEEVQHLEIINCLNCSRCFIIEYEELQPEDLEP